MVTVTRLPVPLAVTDVRRGRDTHRTSEREHQTRGQPSSHHAEGPAVGFRSLAARWRFVPWFLSFAGPRILRIVQACPQVTPRRVGVWFRGAWPRDDGAC